MEVPVHVHRAHLDIRGVVEHLVFGGVEPDLGALFLDHPVEDTAVCHLREPELELEVEVRKGLGGDDVAAHRDIRIHGGRAYDQHAVDHRPSGVRELFAVVAPPAGGRLTVEEEAPAGGVFRLGESVGGRQLLLGGRARPSTGRSTGRGFGGVRARPGESRRQQPSEGVKRAPCARTRGIGSIGGCGARRARGRHASAADRAASLHFPHFTPFVYFIH